MLSFADEEEEEDEGARGDTAQEAKAEEIQPKKRMCKDPAVDTSFLPDRERDQRDFEERKRLQLEWMEMQRKLKVPAWLVA